MRHKKKNSLRGQSKQSPVYKELNSGNNNFKKEREESSFIKEVCDEVQNDMPIYPKYLHQRVAIFVDGSNLHYATKEKLGYLVDGAKLIAYLNKNVGQVVDAYYYNGVSQDSSMNTILDPNFDAESGYVMNLKPVKEIYDRTRKKTSRKCNLDIEICLDMVATCEHYDHAVLVSGDSDFTRVLQVIRSRGKTFTVVATKGSLSRELRDIAGMHTILIEDIRDDVSIEFNKAIS